MAALADAAGQENETTAHVLRRTFGTHLVRPSDGRPGADLVPVAELTGRDLTDGPKADQGESRRHPRAARSILAASSRHPLLRTCQWAMRQLTLANGLVGAVVGRLRATEIGLLLGYDRNTPETRRRPGAVEFP